MGMHMRPRVYYVLLKALVNITVVFPGYMYMMLLHLFVASIYACGACRVKVEESALK